MNLVGKLFNQPIIAHRASRRNTALTYAENPESGQCEALFLPLFHSTVRAFRAGTCVERLAWQFSKYFLKG